jgi:hypothetical protein
MPMDSDLERRTLTKLVQLQDWLQVKAKITVSVRKPVFDASPAFVARRACLESGPPGPVIPDFLLEAEGLPVGGRKTIIVEIMGVRGRDLSTAKDADASSDERPVWQGAHHPPDFHQPQSLSQETRNQRFWLKCRWTSLEGTGRSNVEHR